MYLIDAIETVINHNQCAACIEEEGTFPVPYAALADSGMCGTCGKIDEVYDMTLLNLYFRRGFSIEFIVKYLPRLRLPLSHPNTTPSYAKWWERPGRAMNRGLSLVATEFVRLLATSYLNKVAEAKRARVSGELDHAAECMFEAHRIATALRADGHDIHEFVSDRKSLSQ